MAVSGFCPIRWKRIGKVMLLFYFVTFTTLVLWWRAGARHFVPNFGNDGKPGPNVNLTRTTLTSMTFRNRIMDKMSALSFLGGDGIKVCNGSFVGYDQIYASLHNVVIRPTHSIGRIGGEKLDTVMNQSENSELVKPLHGYFSIECPGNYLPEYSFHKSDHMSSWYKAINVTSSIPNARVIERWTILVERYEYANLYHTMTDWYNAFLLMMKFNLQPDQLDVIWMDGHPNGSLDTAWSRLFGNVIRAQSITGPVVYQNMLWNILGYNSRLSAFRENNTPFLEELREFFLQRFGLPTNRYLDCSNLSVMFIWRRDYVAHPRNPSGHIKRKIKNEEELLKTAVELLPGHKVAGVQVDKFSFQDQLKLASDTDILVGMHGAGLTFSLFLPQHGGVIEFFPIYYGKGNTHFSSMMRWRKMLYLDWENQNNAFEHSNFFTTIPADVFKSLLKNMVDEMCSKKP